MQINNRHYKFHKSRIYCMNIALSCIIFSECLCYYVHCFSWNHSSDQMIASAGATQEQVLHFTENLSVFLCTQRT